MSRYGWPRRTYRACEPRLHWSVLGEPNRWRRVSRRRDLRCGHQASAV